MATRKAGSRARGRPGTPDRLAQNPVQAALARVTRDLKALRQPHALIGGLAVSARGEPRFTRDIDLALPLRSDLRSEQLVFDLQARGYRVDAAIEQAGTGRLATVRTRPPGDSDIVVDLLFASSGVELEVVERAEQLEVFPKLRVRVASAASLVALKVLARSRRRPQDDLDLAALLPQLGGEELAEAEGLLQLIEDRGFARGKKLLPEFERLVRRFRA